MYTVYKITNNINGKFYIGVHKTDNPYDGYMGSGVAIKRAIQKHGRENFNKEVILITESKEEAYSVEKELTIGYNSNDNYNMRLGGVGGFTKENSWKGHIARCKLGGAAAVNKGYGFGGTKQMNPKVAGSIGGKTNKGKPKSEQHKQALRDTWKKKQEMANGEPSGS